MFCFCRFRRRYRRPPPLRKTPLTGTFRARARASRPPLSSTHTQEIWHPAPYISPLQRPCPNHKIVRLFSFSPCFFPPTFFERGGSPYHQLPAPTPAFSPNKKYGKRLKTRSILSISFVLLASPPISRAWGAASRRPSREKEKKHRERKSVFLLPKTKRKTRPRHFPAPVSPSLSLDPAVMPPLHSQRRIQAQQQQPQARCVRLSLPRSFAAAPAVTAVSLLSHLLYSRGQSPSPLRALSLALEREDEAEALQQQQQQQIQRRDHFVRRGLAKARSLVEAFGATAAALLACSPFFFSSDSAAAAAASASEKATVLILFGPSILRPMEAFEVAVPCSAAAAAREQQKEKSNGDDGDRVGEKAQAPSLSLERLVTMRLLQAGLPDGPASRAPTKCFVLVRGPRGGGCGGGAGGGEVMSPAARRQQLLSSSSAPSPPPPGFLPAAGFFWPRVSYARGMIRVRIEVEFERGGEGSGNEMEWQQNTTAAAAAAGASGAGQGGAEGGHGAEESDVWWASTATISGVGGCSAA